MQGICTRVVRLEACSVCCSRVDTRIYTEFRFNKDVAHAADDIPVCRIFIMCEQQKHLRLDCIQNYNMRRTFYIMYTLNST